jgi:hypothetical protein
MYVNIISSYFNYLTVPCAVGSHLVLEILLSPNLSLIQWPEPL